MIDLRGTTILALACGLLLSTSGAISRAGADEAVDYLATAEEQVDAFARCTVDKAWPLIKSQLSVDEIGQRAVKTAMT